MAWTTARTDRNAATRGSARDIEREPGRRAWRGLIAAVALTSFLMAPARGFAADESRTRISQEYDLKAAFLYNFTRFIEWPSDAFASPETPFIIAIIGPDPFGGSLEEIVANERVQNHRIVVHHFLKAAQVDSCQILFVGANGSEQADLALSAVAHRSVLTVGETKAFTEHTGVVSFEVAQRRVRLRINPSAARAARLTISSQLMRQATLVGPEGTTR